MKKILLWIITLILVSAAAFFVWNYIGGKPQEENSIPSAAVVIAKPQRTDIDESLSFNGYIEAQAMIPVVPFVQGTIEQYIAQAGDYVKEDQILAVVDEEPYRLQMQQAEAVYLASKATFERVENMFKKGSVSQQNYDEAKAQYDAYKAQYDLANVQLGYTQVKAPVAGTVLIADSSVGSIATSSSPLFVIADLSKLEVNLNVPEKYYDIVNSNADHLAAVVSREGLSCTAKIKSIAPYISPESKTFKVTLELEGDVSGFKPGMFVNVKLIYNSLKNVPVLDWEVQNPDLSVYSYDEETQTAKYEKIDIRAYDSEHFAIDEKYANTWFIVDGQGSLLDGQKVHVL